SLKTSIKTITYLSDIGCLEIQGASLNATEERHCCWQIEEVSGFVTPEKRSPAIIAGGAVQLIIVCL
ncbi:hypothetical protein, partial [Escherichia coli]|uniref:hypothetical protein n=1 Tax=Escherichia coli TaxID=562 RepID=UPI001BFCA9ED